MNRLNRLKRLRTTFALSALLLAASAPPLSHAGFFIPKGTTMVMGTFSPDEQNYEIAYGFDRRVSGSLVLTRTQEGEGAAPWRNIVTAQLAYLLHRQPTTDGIFNAYVWAGPLAERREHGSGSSTNASATHLGAHGGLWVDYETRSIYTRLKAHTFKSETWRRNEVVAQAMIAPYKADYEDIASWGGLQVKRVSGARTEITPYVRFFQRRWWIDAGVSVDRTHRDNFFLNLSYTF